MGQIMIDGTITAGQEAHIVRQCNDLAKADTEHAHQRAFFGWLAWMKQLAIYPRADRMFAIPNGGKRDPITAARLKAEGVKPGVPDTFFPVPNFEHASYRTRHGLFLEFKKAKGKESGKQSEWIACAIADEYAAATVYSWKDAVAAFIDYVNGREVKREYRS
jgi:hypothetical protein